MIFRQLYDMTSGTYTYLLASRRGGEALIVDPVLEKVDRYLQLMRELDLRLRRRSRPCGRSRFQAECSQYEPRRFSMLADDELLTLEPFRRRPIPRRALSVHRRRDAR